MPPAEVPRPPDDQTHVEGNLPKKNPLKVLKDKQKTAAKKWKKKKGASLTDHMKIANKMAQKMEKRKKMEKSNDMTQRKGIWGTPLAKKLRGKKKKATTDDRPTTAPNEHP